jgi:hypothetical protein
MRAALNNVYFLNYDNEDFEAQRPEHLEEFNTLIAHCEKYLSTHKNPKTDVGRERLAIARQTLEQALADRAALMTFEPGAAAGKRPLLEALAEHSRGEVIDTGGETPDFVGGQMSQRFKVASGGKPAFFTKEERIDDNLKTKNPTAYETMVNGKGRMKHGDVVSNRNVGMSRMAKLLGVEDVLANSKNASMKVGDETHKGIVMEAARGKSASSFTRDEMRDADSGIFTGNLQRQLMSLQVLDTICAQADRHDGNFFISSTKGEDGKVKSLDSLQGIDNDMAFGSWSMDELNKTTKIVGGGANTAKGIKIADGTDMGYNTIPLMDKALADRIQALDVDTIRYHMADIITDPEQMNALLGRFEEMKSYVGTLKEQDGKPKDGDGTGAPRKTLLEPGDWGEESYDTLTEGMRADRFMDPKTTGNYVKALNYFMTPKTGKVNNSAVGAMAHFAEGGGDVFKKQKLLRNQTSG